METTREDRRLCRKFVHESWNGRAVEVVPGMQRPTLVGKSWHYETRGGRRIHHPSAYSRRGWSNMVYIPSTLRVEVGADWLVNARRILSKWRREVA